MSKIDIVSFWSSSGSIGMAPYVNTSADGGHIDYEGVYSKVDLNTRMQTIVSALPDFFESYRIVLTDVNLSGVLVSKAECILKASSSSDVPDYTQLLTRIANALDTNSQDTVVNKLQEINEKLLYLSALSGGNNSNTIQPYSNLRYLAALSNSSSSGSDSQRTYSFLRIISRVLTSDLSNPDQGSFLYKILNCLKQSVSPNASITDVISALNATIDSKQNTTVVNNEVTPLAEINIDVPFEVKNLKKSDVEN